MQDQIIKALEIELGYFQWGEPIPKWHKIETYISQLDKLSHNDERGEWVISFMGPEDIEA